MEQRIHVHAMAWNEERFLPYFIRHYLTFADKIVIYDNESDDRTVEVAQSFPKTEVRMISSGGEMRDDILIGVKNNALEVSRGEADWVVAVDIDEIVWHRNMRQYLAACSSNGVAMLGSMGFNMISPTFPDTPGQAYQQVKTGASSPMYSKAAIFSPTRVRAVNYQVGAHHAQPVTDGQFLQNGSEIVLMHFALMSLDYVLERYKARGMHLSQINRQNRWSEHFSWSAERLTQGFNGILKIAKPLPFLSEI